MQILKTDNKSGNCLQDKALQEIDQSEEKSSSEYETDEEWEIERKKQLANEEKNKVLYKRKVVTKVAL